ncbi:helix-turn-helix domain-containing protein [Streptomyces sp. VRA16 Mangrove soil]|uniref:helix-turn-helix domain-containing protein n=1 Tax=Streptomyces sp. VRA16 Mangrove soil TaxID=2817434 RepID=UPI001A9E8678|nr:helix-turn-helix transcriptional regulator [Streptomyces sp. VRA16 Mangrove soil]MBO1336703.1 helix-turn-helix transcriptional regulator [Streptomyces sp. VRA16 Mangrove soil]
MSSEERRVFGAKVADLRKQRGLTQSELAAEIGRTSSWLSQVERGIQPVNRLDVLRLLADGLGVPLQVLQPDAPAAAEPEPAAHTETNDLDQARLILSGHPAVDVLLTPREDFRPTAMEDLRAAAERIWELTHTDQFAELSAALGPLLPRLERATRVAPEEFRNELHWLNARTYQALAAAFVRQNEADAAWVAADRAIREAELSGEPLGVFAGIYRLSHAFVRLKHLDQAEHSTTLAVNALQRYVEEHEPTPQHLSVLGSLHLMLALIHARAGERTTARTQINKAREVAAQLGEDRNDFNLEFGPTNVEIQAVSTAVDLGDAGEALDIGENLDASNLSVERRARLLMDLGRAHAQRRHFGDALSYLLAAEELAPEMIRTHIAARDVIRELILVAGRAASDDLRALAERADALG